jgi:predicted AlkP superfamily phosphohydrolase/phosphomutase
MYNNGNGNGNSSKRRVFAIGLDGATYDLVEPWVQAGHLPTMARLLKQGTSGVLRSVVPPLTMPAWASYLTGKTPGHHGLYAFLRREPGSYNLSPFNASYLQSATVDHLLNRHGKRVILMNVPSTYPPQPLNGVVVTGLETPSRNNRFTYPAELGPELIRRFDYEIEVPEKYEPGKEDIYLAAVERVEKKRLEAVLWLMDKEEWDFFAVVFRGTDVLGHAFWRFHDPTHPAHQPELYAQYGDALLKHYQWMDQTIATLEAKLGENTILTLMSDHGFGAMHRDVYIDNVMLKSGLIHLQSTPKARFRQTLFQLGLTPHNALAILEKLGLLNLVRGMLSPEKRSTFRRKASLQDSVDWTRTKAYPLGGGGHICINLKGREPQGIVEPGEEYERVCQEVEEALRALRDPDTGQPMVSRVWRRKEVYGKNHLEEIPDLYVEWQDDHYTDLGGIGFTHGLMSEPLRGRAGGHTMRGMFLVRGPGIKSGHKIEGANLYDLAPTIMHLLDTPVPAGLDGRVLVDILEKRTSVVYSEAVARLEEERHVFSADEQKVVEQRLKDLGYI